MAKTSQQKTISDISTLLGDPTLNAVKPEIPSNTMDDLINVKSLLVAQTFNTFLLNIIERHGNAQTLNRKHELAKSEIESALKLSLLVGKLYDNIAKDADNDESEVGN